MPGINRGNSYRLRPGHSLIKQYDELLHKRWDLASDEQKARIAQIKAQTDKLKGTDNEEELSRLDQVLSEIKGVV